MQLSPSECRIFYKLHPALMCYANYMLKTLPDQPGDPARFYALEAEKATKRMRRGLPNWRKEEWI